MLRRWRASCDSEQCWGILPSLPWRANVCRATLCAQLEAFRGLPGPAAYNVDLPHHAQLSGPGGIELAGTRAARSFVRGHAALSRHY